LVGRKSEAKLGVVGGGKETAMIELSVCLSVCGGESQTEATRVLFGHRSIITSEVRRLWGTLARHRSLEWPCWVLWYLLLWGANEISDVHVHIRKVMGRT